MKTQSRFAFVKRTFLNPASTRATSYVQAHVETGRDGPYKWGDNMIIIADCKSVIKLEYFLGNKKARRIALAKINLLIDTLTRFRDALVKEIESIEKAK